MTTKEIFFPFAATMDGEFESRQPESLKQNKTAENEIDPSTPRHDDPTLAYPKKVTPHWLVTNVDWKIWAGAAVILLSVFLAGIHAGQFSFVKEIFIADETKE